MGIFGFKRVKPKTCRVCRQKFTPTRPMQPVCESFDCKVAYATKAAEKSAQRRNTAERKADATRRDAMKRASDLRAEAQAAFNAFIRYRDLSAGHRCICCDMPFEDQRPGGSVDAGHYLSRGSHPNLAFDERNVHAQRKNCNRPGGTTAAAFRVGMIKRIGLEAVEALERDTTPRRYRADDFRAIRDLYRAKLKSLKAARPMDLS